MISSGLTVQKRARFEEGYPSDHNGLNRYVHEERPYVQTKIYSQLPPSEYSDPELKPRYTVLSETKYEHLFEHQLTPDERLYLYEQSTQNGGQIGRTYSAMPTYNVNTPMVLPHQTNVEDGRMDGTGNPPPNPTPNTREVVPYDGNGLNPEVPSYVANGLYPEVPTYEHVVIDDLETELNAETFIETIQNGMINAVDSGTRAVGRGIGNVVSGGARMVWNNVNVAKLFQIAVPADLYMQLIYKTGAEVAVRALLPPSYAEKVIDFGRNYVDTHTQYVRLVENVQRGVSDQIITGQRWATDTFSDSDFAQQFKNIFSNAEISALEMINQQPTYTDSLIRSAGEITVGAVPQLVFGGVLSLVKLTLMILSAPLNQRRDPQMLRRIATSLNGIYWQNPTGPRRLN